MGDLWVRRALDVGATVLLTKVDSTSWKDLGSNAHQATFVNDAVNGGSLIGSAMTDSIQLDGIDDSVTFPDHADFDVTDPWSIEFVLNPVAGTDIMTIVTAGTAAATNGFMFQVEDGDVGGSEKLTFTIRDTGSTVDDADTGAGSLPMGERSHWVFVYASGSTTVYKNGASLSTSAATVADVNSSLLRVGNNEAATLPYDGLIGNIAIYKSTGLTAAQALDAYETAFVPHGRNRFAGPSRNFRRRLLTGSF